MAEVTDEAHARFFTEVPGQAGRDLNDYTRTIGADGEAVWFTTGDRNQKRPVIIEKPENGAWYVYDHTGRDMKCVSSSWTLSEDRPFYLPEDGRVVLVGEAGAAFTIRYAD